MITAPLPRASPSGSGRLSMIIPQNHGLTITYIVTKILRKIRASTFTERLRKITREGERLG